MAEAKSTAAKRPATRKPAARKTTAARKPATRKPAAEKVTPVEAIATDIPVTDETLPEEHFGTDTQREYTEEERQGLLASYTALKNAGLPVPDDISKPVEAWIALEQERREAENAERAKYQEAVEAENAAGPWFVRNGYSGAPLSMRLERQTEKRRIELKPRGIPGDMHPIEDSDLKDAVLKENVRIGVCEIIPAGEANRIAAQQTTNVQSRVHVPTAILRNAKGEEYAAGSIKTEIEYGAQGITVGTIDPEQVQGKYEDRAVANAPLGGINRTTDSQGNPVQAKREVASQFIPTGGNPYIIQNGPPQAAQPGGIPQLDAAKAKIADDLARRAGNANPLAGMRVTVNAPQKG